MDGKPFSADQPEVTAHSSVFCSIHLGSRLELT